MYCVSLSHLLMPWFETWELQVLMLCFLLWCVQDEGKKGWYDFDDRHVGPITEDSIKTSAAYVLFYRRIQEDSLDTGTDIDSDIVPS